jgi:hypothetical protein
MLNNDVAKVKSVTDSIGTRIHELKENYVKVEKRCLMMMINLRHRMEIKGLSESELENVKDWKAFVVEILRKFKVRCEEEKIERAYKKVVNTVNLFSLIVVWFYDEGEKNRVMREKFEYQKKSSKVKFTSIIASLATIARYIQKLSKISQRWEWKWRLSEMVKSQ